MSAAKARPGAGAGKPKVPTEREVLDVLDVWEDGAAYRKARYAANVGACYSTEAICELHEHFGNQRLTDDLVMNRLAYAEFTAAELNPTRPGAPSVCEHVSVPVLNRLLRGMRGGFTPDEADHFVDYHLEDCDAETLRLVADRTSFTRAERREFFELSDWMVNPEFAPGSGTADEPAKTPPADPQGARKGQRPLRALLLALAIGAAAIVGIATGAIVAIGAVGGVALVLALLTGGRQPARPDRYPDVRSDHNRRVWADGHNWEADGDTSHDYEADGDAPW